MSRPFNHKAGDKKGASQVKYSARKDRSKVVSPEFINVTVKRAHCPRCWGRLWGENSEKDPWYCPCGKWEFLSDNNYKIV